jgi:hypothetical protein
MEHLKVLAVGATRNRNIMLTGEVPHGEAATRKQMIPDRRCLGVRD